MNRTILFLQDEHAITIKASLNQDDLMNLFFPPGEPIPGPDTPPREPVVIKAVNESDETVEVCIRPEKCMAWITMPWHDPKPQPQPSALALPRIVPSGGH